MDYYFILWNDCRKSSDEHFHFIIHSWITLLCFLTPDDLAGQSVEHASVLTARAAVFLPERESEWRRGTEQEGEEEEEEEEAEERRGGMGVGKNTTPKSMDSAAEPGKYEEENKHSAHFYPIPVSVCSSVWNDANHRVRNNAF